ncbi:MAG TPA: prepilin-type N-terminal cleavage/methylation domain-containing protein [Lacunisphaera sp.]|nr:prepilin-type N-terminal cleavage/methylation domain-containing protein [Lacunisphaera sp.]
MALRSSRFTRAFTLIEVLVSLAIFAIAAVVLSVSYLNIIGSYRSMSHRHDTEEDWKWVRSVVLAEPEKEKVEEGGQLALPDGRQVNWSAKIEQAGVADLFRLTLEVDAPASGTIPAWQRSEALHVLRPSWSDPTVRDELRNKTKQRVEREQRS